MEQVPQVYIDELRNAHGSIHETLRVLNAVETNQYIPLDNLLESIDSMSTAVPESRAGEVDGYVFASGRVNLLTRVKYQKYTSLLAQGGHNLVTIGDTQASQLLEEGSMVDHLERALVGSGSLLKLGNILHGYTEDDGTRQPGVWDKISSGYARSAHGIVITVTPNSNEHRVFVQSELPELIANENVTSINGLPIGLYVDYFDALSAGGLTPEEIYPIIDRDLVQGSSIEFMKRYSPDFCQDLGVAFRHDFGCAHSPEARDIFLGAVPKFVVADNEVTYTALHLPSQAEEQDTANLHHS